ncbi:MAG: hypothetical protein HRF45_11120 [Fimbriimonadia bacterium]|jgi:hypothetical protein
MSKRWLLATLAIVCLLLVTGCKPSIVGKWNVDTTIQGVSAKGTIEYKKDNSMVGELVASAGGQQAPISMKGTWRMEQKDEKQYLSVKFTEIKLAGQPIPVNAIPEQKSEVTFGKNSMTLTAQDGSGMTSTYTKAE